MKSTEAVKNENNWDDIEFHLNENMMDFITQSIKHKIELKNQNEIVDIRNKIKEIRKEKFNRIYQRNKDAKLLYGNGSSRVLAMEAALDSTIERHIDKTKPQYWPNIPLKF
jgi:hypothetical protein